MGAAAREFWPDILTPKARWEAAATMSSQTIIGMELKEELRNSNNAMSSHPSLQTTRPSSTRMLSSIRENEIPQNLAYPRNAPAGPMKSVSVLV